MKKLLFTLIGTLSIIYSPLAKADEASHKQAAQDLLKAAEMEEVFSKTIDQALDMQIKQAPQLAELKDVMKAFFNKYMSWDALKDDLTKLYEDNFTEEELKEITTFYKTPAGKKMAKTTPELMTKGSMLGQQKVQEHMPELQKMVQEAMAKKGGK